VPSSATHQHVQRMLDEIHQHYNHHINLSVLAKVLRRQSAYVGRLFRDEIGLTVHEYVTRARMVFGASQVRTGVKIEAVSLDLGYRSKKNFYRQFRRRFGMTPAAYRYDFDDSPARGSIQGPRSSTTGDHRRDAPSRSTLNDRAAGFTSADTQDRALAVAQQRRTMVRSLAGSCVALLVTDERGQYVVATKAAVALTGYSVDELRGMPADILFPDATGATPRCCLLVVRPAPSGPATSVLQTKSAGRIPVHVTSVENLLGRHQQLTLGHSEGVRRSA
jgi:AraC-like DNA-binding protein